MLPVMTLTAFARRAATSARGGKSSAMDRTPANDVETSPLNASIRRIAAARHLKIQSMRLLLWT